MCIKVNALVGILNVNKRGLNHTAASFLNEMFKTVFLETMGSA